MHGIFKLSQKPLTVAIPILIPVKEPDPTSQTINSISFNSKFAFFRAELRMAIFSNCI